MERNFSYAILQTIRLLFIQPLFIFRKMLLQQMFLPVNTMYQTIQFFTELLRTGAVLKFRNKKFNRIRESRKKMRLETIKALQVLPIAADSLPHLSGQKPDDFPGDGFRGFFIFRRQVAQTGKRLALRIRDGIGQYLVRGMYKFGTLLSGNQ